MNHTDALLVSLVQRPIVDQLSIVGVGRYEAVASRPVDTTYVKEQELAADDVASPADAGIMGDVAIELTSASTTVRFTPHDPAAFRNRPGGPARIRAADGSWTAVRVGYVGPVASEGTELFDCALLACRSGNSEPVAATRMILAGAAWFADATVDGEIMLARPVSQDAASHYDKRMTLVARGKLTHRTIDDLARAAGFVSGLEVPAERVERYDATGNLIESEDRRWLPRVGWAPHSPFTRVSADARARAFEALATTLARGGEDGFPLRRVVDQIASSYNARDIHLSAQLLALAIVTATSHGYEIGLPAADAGRLEQIRAELLERGYFHEPGYETGRPQRDIKFLRDIANAIVLRACGYAGTYYGAERFTTLDLAGTPS